MRGRGGDRGSGRLGTGFRGGVGRGFLSGSHLGRGPEPLTLAASSLTWPASKAKAESKEVQRSWSSSWGREGAVRGAEEGEMLRADSNDWSS